MAVRRVLCDVNTAFVKSAKRIVDKAMRLEWRLNWVIENGNKQDRLEILRNPQKVHIWKKWLMEPYVGYLSGEEIDVLLGHLGGSGPSGWAPLKLKETTWDGRSFVLEGLAHCNRLSTEQKRRYARYCSADLNPQKCELSGPIDLRTGIWLARIRGSNFGTLSRLAANRAVDGRVFLYVFRSDPKNWVSEKEFKGVVFKRLWDWAVETQNKQVIEELCLWVAKHSGALGLIGPPNDQRTFASLLVNLPMALRLNKWPEEFSRDMLYQRHAESVFVEWMLKERKRCGQGGVGEIINDWAIKDPQKVATVWKVLLKEYKPRLSKEAIAGLLACPVKEVRELGIRLIAENRVEDSKSQEVSTTGARRR